MFTIHANGARLFAALVFLLFCSAALAGSAKVEICHIPPDDPDNYHTIKINENALAAHLAHFDLPGPCDLSCAELCDDGNACTIDYEGDCHVNGCSTVSRPVDCNDNNACTTDACDSAGGCSNTVAVTCEASDNLCEIGGDTCDPNTGECVAPMDVVCDSDNETCNPSTGQCESDNPDPDACPCFLAIVETDGQTCIAGSDFDVVTFSGGVGYCSGSACGGTTPSCYLEPGPSEFFDNLTTQQNTNCRNLIRAKCGLPDLPE